MSTRERFGKYLLLKKLTEDPLGETFRAGMLGGEGIERVVLLRIFNGQAIDPQRLWEATRGRAGIHPLLRSPNLGEGVEMGELQGIPYIAYDYISGKNLAVLLDQAAKKQNFIPTEHALLITERIALALVVASECRFEGERIMHGFLVPQLVMISNEGETRLLGFEIAPGTRGFAANPLVRRHFGRYLAPEALRGAPPHRSDDVFSLGVMLFELLTGRPLPPPATDGYSSVIDHGVLATEGSPVPPELVQLLKQSLVTREHRLQDIAAWHKTLNKWMFDGQYNPTTFNLAFYMHNLFRDEIERESQEIEVEKTLSLPIVQQPAQPMEASRPAAPTAPTPAPAAPVVAPAPPPAEPPAKSKNTGALLGVAALLAVGVGGYFVWQSMNTPKDPAAELAAAPPAAPVETGPTQSEQQLAALQAQIEELIAQRAKTMEQQIRGDYDKQLKELQSQLEDARTTAERERQQREVAVAQSPPSESAPKTEEPVVETAPPSPPPEVVPPPPEEPVAAPSPPPTPPPSPPPSPPTEAQRPAKPQVRRGDLVEFGPGVEQPRTLRPARPRFPEVALRLNKKGADVKVRLLIDENGKVLKTELAGEKQGFGFDAEALQAAESSLYSPATKNGVPVKIWYTITVRFQRD